MVFRPARADDLEAADALVVSSINDPTVRHGFGQMASPSPPNFQLFSLGGRSRRTLGDWAGYAYVDAGGHVGPVAVLQASAVARAFRTALRLATESDASQVSAFLPGASEAALSMALEYGMRIKFPMLLMSSRDFGSWAQYLPRNPGFM